MSSIASLLAAFVAGDGIGLGEMGSEETDRMGMRQNVMV